VPNESAANLRGEFLLRFRSLLGAAAAFAVLFLSGCATKPQLPVALNAEAVKGPGTRIGVAMTPLPKIDTHFPGAGCLLCIAAASVANSSLTAHTKTLGYEDLKQLKATVAELIRKRGAEPIIISDGIDLRAYADRTVPEGASQARKDFSSMQKKYGVDKLLLIDLQVIGFERTYSSYFPTSDPKAVVRGSASLIDLKTHVLDWYSPLSVMRASDGAWDEPPKYPGLSNAYFQVIELGKDEVVKPFMP